MIHGVETTKTHNRQLGVVGEIGEALGCGREEATTAGLSPRTSAVDSHMYKLCVCVCVVSFVLSVSALTWFSAEFVCGGQVGLTLQQDI